MRLTGSGGGGKKSFEELGCGINSMEIDIYPPPVPCFHASWSVGGDGETC